MGLVTVLSPLRMTGVVELVVQSTPEPRFVVDSKMYPEGMVDQVKITLVPARVMASRGCGSGSSGRSTGLEFGLPLRRGYKSLGA